MTVLMKTLTAKPPVSEAQGNQLLSLNLFTVQFRVGFSGG